MICTRCHSTDGSHYPGCGEPAPPSAASVGPEAQLTALVKKAYLDGCIEACGEPHRNNWNGWWAMYGKSLVAALAPAETPEGEPVAWQYRHTPEEDWMDGEKWKALPPGTTVEAFQQYDHYQTRALVVQRTHPTEPEGIKPYTKEVIVAQLCDECGAACRCEFDGSLMLSSKCCVHGESECDAEENEK